MSCLRYLCLFACPRTIVLCFCSIFLRFVYLMLPVSLDCPFWIAPLVFYLGKYLNIKYLATTKCRCNLPV